MLHPDFSIIVSIDKSTVVVRNDKQDIFWGFEDEEVSFSRHCITVKELQDITMLITYFYNRKEK